MEQCSDWWAEQTAIKEALNGAEREAAAAHAELVKYQDMLQLAAKSEEAALRRALAGATADYNRRLAEEKRLRDIAAKQADLAANMAEMEATITSGMMTEDPNMAASALSAYRVRKDHFKVRCAAAGWGVRVPGAEAGVGVYCKALLSRCGRSTWQSAALPVIPGLNLASGSPLLVQGMTETERQAILDAQLAQMEEKKARRAQEALEDMMYARSQHDIQRALSEQVRRARSTQAPRACMGGGAPGGMMMGAGCGVWEGGRVGGRGRSRTAMAVAGQSAPRSGPALRGRGTSEVERGLLAHGHLLQLYLQYSTSARAMTSLCPARPLLTQPTHP